MAELVVNFILRLNCPCLSSAVLKNNSNSKGTALIKCSRKAWTGAYRYKCISNSVSGVLMVSHVQDHRLISASSMFEGCISVQIKGPYHHGFSKSDLPQHQIQVCHKNQTVTQFTHMCVHCPNICNLILWKNCFFFFLFLNLLANKERTEMYLEREKPLVLKLRLNLSARSSQKSFKGLNYNIA